MSLGNKLVMSHNIQHYLDLNKITRADLCTALDIKYTTLSEWMRGRTYPRIDKIEAMANYFGISKADLVEEHNNTNALEHAFNERPEMRELFIMMSSCTPDEVRKATKILQALSSK